MANFEYKVVPFMGVIKSGETAGHVGAQLQSVLNEHGVGGWEFYELDEVNIEVKPGCLAGLFGGTSSYIKFDQVIFRKPRA